MSALLAAAGARPAGGAALTDVALLGGAMTALIAGWIALLAAYRRGGARPLRALEARAGRLLGIPGWAAVPGLGAIGGALLTIWGATWDIGFHIDVGRDSGPFGTLAHYPLLVGLQWMFMMGVLAVAMAPASPRLAGRAAIRVSGLTVPAGAALMTAAGGFALLGFPLDDLWHRVFGQDVTLWGPTHTMFIGGVLCAGCGGALLLAEGARAVGRDPFGAPGGILRRPAVALVLGIFLYFWTAVLHEFNWGVPQYREIWQPLFLALGGAHAMVAARLLGGRGGTLGPLLVWMPVQVAMSLAIGGPLGRTAPAMPLFIAEAAAVELLAARGDWRSPVRFGAVAGLLSGAAGFASMYGWSQIAMPIAWTPALLKEGIPVALAAAVAGGVLGALMALALQGRLREARRPGMLAAGATAAVLALGANAAMVRSPAGLEATIALSGVREGTAPGGGRTTVADVAVRLGDPSPAVNANWAYALAWQGGGRYAEPLERRADGTLRSTAPVPIGGDWKSFVRFHKGRTLVAAPVRMPADPALDFAGYPAPAARPATRALVRDTRLLQIERSDDGPLWAWTPAFLLVLASDLMLVAFLGAACVRIGGAAPADAPAAARPQARALR